MAFEAALEKARSLGGDTKEFCQANLNYCTGFAARWLKYQLLGKPAAYWETNMQGRNPVFATAQGAYFATAAGQTKLQALYDHKATQRQADGTYKAGRATDRYLKGALNKGFAPMAESDEHPFSYPSTTASIENLGLELDQLVPGRGVHISLRPSGVNGSLHSVAAFREPERLVFFDSYMGEVRIPAQAFPGWLAYLRALWSTDSDYAQFTEIVLTEFDNTAQLAARARQVRSQAEAERLLAAMSEDELLELLGDFSPDPLAAPVPGGAAGQR